MELSELGIHLDFATEHAALLDVFPRFPKREQSNVLRLMASDEALHLFDVPPDLYGSAGDQRIVLLGEMVKRLSCESADRTSIFHVLGSAMVDAGNEGRVDQQQRLLAAVDAIASLNSQSVSKIAGTGLLGTIRVGSRG